MFRLVRQIHDVSDPLISGLEIVYVDSHQVIIKTEKNFDTVENHLSVPFALIGITGNEIILRTNEAIISLNAGSAVKETHALVFSGDTQIKLLYDSDKMIVRNSVQHGWRLCKYNFRHSQIIWEREDNDTLRVFRFESYLIATQFENKGLLTCFNETDGALLWQLNINELGLPGTGYELVNRPQAHKNYLLLSIRQGFNIYLLGININTGQLRWYLQGPGLWFGIANDKILCFYNKDILQIDPATGAILHAVSVLDKLTAAGIDPYGNLVFKDHHMYLAGILDTIISVWDINTGALLWQHRLYDKSLTGRRGISIPASESILQVHENRIYVLDSQRVLNVFERI